MMRMTGGGALVEMLRRNGVDTIFALPGVQNDVLFVALYDAGEGLRVIHTRHEQGAAYMALGAALATGKPQAYARFLGYELSLAYKQRLLVVMPNGFGFNWPKHSPKDGYAVLAKVPLQHGTAGIIASATAAVQELAAAAGVKT